MPSKLMIDKQDPASQHMFRLFVVYVYVDLFTVCYPLLLNEITTPRSPNYCSTSSIRCSFNHLCLVQLVLTIGKRLMECPVMEASR